MNPLDAINNKIRRNHLNSIMKILGISVENIDKSLSLENDDSTPFEKSIEKHYSIIEKIDLSDEFKHLLSVEIVDYGVEIDGFDDDDDAELYKNLGGNEQSPLNLEINHVNYKDSEILIRGGFFGDLLMASAYYPKINLSVVGLEKSTYDNFDLYKTLIYEAYILEKNNDFKVSFFTYFSAIESLISIYIIDYSNKIHKELHHALEHLSLDEKIRIVAKEIFNTEDLSQIQLWGELMSKFKNVKSMRNEIAHASSKIEIKKDDIDNVFFCFCTLYAVTNHGAKSFKEMNKLLF